LRLVGIWRLRQHQPAAWPTLREALAGAAKQATLLNIVRARPLALPAEATRNGGKRNACELRRKLARPVSVSRVHGIKGKEPVSLTVSGHSGLPNTW